MAKKNIIEETNERIVSLVENKAQELEQIGAEIYEAREKSEAFDMAILDAIGNMNLEAFNKAKAEKKKAESAIEMYTARYEMLKTRKLVTEEDSDKTIDNILAYEEDLAKEYEEAIQDPIKVLLKLYEEYAAAVQAAETTLATWTYKIHENYRSKGTKYANGTNRSDTPVPVRRTAYTGSSASAVMKEALTKLEKLIPQEE